jgi:hypothetical protein
MVIDLKKYATSVQIILVIECRTKIWWLQELYLSYGLNVIIIECMKQVFLNLV